MSLRILEIVEHIREDTRRDVDTIAVLVEDFEKHLQDTLAERWQIPLGEFLVLFTNYVAGTSIPKKNKD